MKKAVGLIENIFLKVAALFFLIFFICVILQVASRYIPGIRVLWAGEIATYAFIWMIFVGAAVMIREKGHFTVGLVIDNVKGLTLFLVQSLTHVLIVAFGIVMIVDGYGLTQQFWDWTLNNLPQIRQGYAWLAIPVGGAGMILFALANWWEDFMKYKAGDKGEAA
ncbi:TRAP transporter small permease [Alkalicoccus daliensis]|uniref:TRAP-type C4-dicarboxylate transport system, small permease component n=1 Tax=Alkalicoccus daliensis TaxID=745820 RepID=A0A1H0G895_9BACI|nr:TRAP transporter small permease [Alkalicoccus daliensis]SDO03054.1 TRAP-type C4-dicarboxylate transport system, small permease component [Alkalicoccus daliensis]